MVEFVRTCFQTCWIGNDEEALLFSKCGHDENNFVNMRILQNIFREGGESWLFKVNRKEDSLVVVVKNQKSGKEMELLPVQIMSLLLKKIHKFIIEAKGDNITGVVIAIPAYFNDEQRQTILNAARISGIEVNDLINEPRAALLSLEQSFPNDFSNIKNLIVFNLGRETLCVSVCKNRGHGVIDVIKSGSVQNLGGSNFDLVLSDIIKNKILDKYPKATEMFENYETVVELRKVAEKVKVELSTKDTCKVPLNGIFNGILKQEQIEAIGEINIKRVADFEGKCKELFDSCKNCICRTIIRCGITKEDINKVILIGGSSNIPKIKEMIEKYFDNHNIVFNKRFNLSTIIAMGASIHAKHISNNSILLQPNISNTVPHSIGIETNQGIFSKIIDKDSSIPVQRTLVLHSNIKSTQILIQLYQGEKEFVNSEGMQFIGGLVLKNTNPCLSTSRIQITLKYDHFKIEVSAINLNDKRCTASIIIGIENLEDNSNIEKYYEQVYEIMPDFK